MLHYSTSNFDNLKELRHHFAQTGYFSFDPDKRDKTMHRTIVSNLIVHGQTSPSWFIVANCTSSWRLQWLSGCNIRPMGHGSQGVLLSTFIWIIYSANTIDWDASKQKTQVWAQNKDAGILNMIVISKNIYSATILNVYINHKYKYIVL